MLNCSVSVSELNSYIFSLTLYTKKTTFNYGFVCRVSLVTAMSDVKEPESVESSPNETITRTESINSVQSTESYDSDDLESEEEEKVYQTAPEDIIFESPQIGKVLVLKKGEEVPCLTKYKKTKKGGLTLIRFR